jgi:Ca2+-binding RTX toxin-like protein
MRLGVVLVTIALPASLLTAAPAAQAQAAACRGLAATIEGLSNQTITGTAGNDVIVAPYGSFGFVDAGDGNDVICLVPGERLPGNDFPQFTVDAGAGDDIVDSTPLAADASTLFLPSSAGRDAFYGGPEQDQVTIPAVNGVPPTVDTETDAFVTGAGDDVVMSGSLGLPNGDVIDVGVGDDVVLYAGTGASGDGKVIGGPGTDTLWPTAHDPVDPPDDPLPPGYVVFSARTGSATIAGAPYLTWTGIEDYELSDIVHHHVMFLGSSADEQVALSRGPVIVRMRGGDDSVSHYYPSLPDGSVSGGAGRDSLNVDVRGKVNVDLRREAVLRDGDTTVHLRLAGFEDAKVSGRSVTLLGTHGPDRLVATGRKGVAVRGLAGADVIRVRVNTILGPLPGNERQARGGPGRDRLYGSFRNDDLIGGGGRDVADGGSGRDFCLSEIRIDCER